MRLYRAIDSALLKEASLSSEMKLIIAEIHHWISYYSQRNQSFSYNPVKISHSLGLSIYDTVELIDILVQRGIITISESNFRVFFNLNTFDIDEIIKGLKD